MRLASSIVLGLLALGGVRRRVRTPRDAVSQQIGVTVSTPAPVAPATTRRPPRLPSPTHLAAPATATAPADPTPPLHRRPIPTQVPHRFPATPPLAVRTDLRAERGVIGGSASPSLVDRWWPRSCIVREAVGRLRTSPATQPIWRRCCAARSWAPGPRGVSGATGHCASKAGCCVCAGDHAGVVVVLPPQNPGTRRCGPARSS